MYADYFYESPAEVKTTLSTGARSRCASRLPPRHSRGMTIKLSSLLRYRPTEIDFTRAFRNLVLRIMQNRASNYLTHTRVEGEPRTPPVRGPPTFEEIHLHPGRPKR
ncbi:hypothetical protein PUN28_018443 [Cardiocondyla obscurior]|uniref:Uncharacterized protein n=1 Tax=Cardiocondyla obscurior TaxID=286306 RepID=A0AAW2EHN8_9HYME